MAAVFSFAGACGGISFLRFFVWTALEIVPGRGWFDIVRPECLLLGDWMKSERSFGFDLIVACISSLAGIATFVLWVRELALNVSFRAPRDQALPSLSYRNALLPLPDSETWAGDDDLREGFFFLLLRIFRFGVRFSVALVCVLMKKFDVLILTIYL